MLREPSSFYVSVVASLFFCIPIYVLATNEPTVTASQDTISTYQEHLKSIQQQALTIENELEIVDTKTKLTQAQIQQITIELEKNFVEQEHIHKQITLTEQEITQKQQQIQKLLREIYHYDQQTFLEITLLYSTLGEFSTLVGHVQEITKQLQSSFDDLQILRKNLEDEQTALQQQHIDQKNKQTELAVQQQVLEGESAYKNELLTTVQSDEAKFQALIKSLRAEQADIGVPTTSEAVPETTFEYPASFQPIWPVEGIITTRFRDPNYLFRSAFEHDAIDIAVPQSTPIKAADNGIVDIVRYDGTPRYAWIRIQQANNFSTVYGHVSQVFVVPGETVQKGQTIALSGGARGGIGSGSYTTNPHLHFGILKNFTAADPLLYLQR